MAVGIFPLRALQVGVVEAQDERAALAPGEQRIEQRRAGVADWIGPVGDGAKRTMGAGMFRFWRTLWTAQRRLTRTRRYGFVLPPWPAPWRT